MANLNLELLCKQIYCRSYFNLACKNSSPELRCYSAPVSNSTQNQHVKAFMFYQGSYCPWITWKVVKFDFQGLESHGIQLLVLEGHEKLKFCLVD